MPMASSAPKSWTIGTWEMRTVRKAMTAATVAATIGGPVRASVSPNGSAFRSSVRSSSMRFWIWMANSMPRPIRIGSPAIVTSDSFVPVKPKAPNPQMTPTTMPSSGSSRHLTPNVTTRMTVITNTAMPPSVSIPLCRESLISVRNVGVPVIVTVACSNVRSATAASTAADPAASSSRSAFPTSTAARIA